MEREIRLLEFDKIRSSLAGLTTTPMGRELAEDLLPDASFATAVRWQAETSEAASLLRRQNLGMERVPDLRRALELAARGGMLAEESLLGVLVLLTSVTRLKTFFRKQEDYPLLGALAEAMSSLPELRERLREVVDDEGKMRDTATPELARLRRALREGERELRERFEKFLRNPANQKLLQETLVTQRGGRMVLPVRQEARSQVPGVVHDQSASGATVFVEPLWAVEAHNRLAMLESKAERERERILIRLSGWIGGERELLLETLTLYAELDFILAKGRLSLAWRAVEPKLNENGYLRINAGRHPLLSGEVVPISLELGQEFRTLVITGPNTGGKTVTLKTVGLFSLLAKAGLHVPAGEGTVLAVFPGIYADIGDEQNIEQSLSTFSGHLKNIIGIIEKLLPGSLVLLDEVGAGTDPTEGAGLAMSLLEYFHARGAVTVATTHYSQLKAFAYVTEGMENASVEFDVASLRPTFQLLVGVPGQSNAFAIAARLGLPGEIIDRGRAFLSQEETRLEEVVADLVASRRRLEISSEKAEQDRREAEATLARLRRDEEILRQKKQEILDKARAEALDIVTGAKKEAKRLIKELRRLSAQAGPPEPARLEQVAAPVLELEEELRAALFRFSEKGSLCREELVPGREVLVNSLKRTGVIIQVHEHMVQVQVGAMRINVEPDDLLPARPPQKEETPAVTGLPLFAGKDVLPEISVRGLTLDEAILAVDNYLDEAVLAGLREIRLIHGKGTGVLRSGLREHLKKHRLVASLRAAHQHEGGLGATVVQLK